MMKARKPWERDEPTFTHEEPAIKPWQRPQQGAFALHAAKLIENGYSPIPVTPGTKRPPEKEWNSLRSQPYTIDVLPDKIRTFVGFGLAVAGGFNGLVPIDIDTEDAEIVEAVCRVLPQPLVAKKGQKGYAAFYRAPQGWVPEGRKFLLNKAPIVEVLGTGKSIIPPTIHPDTRRPYEWLTPATLLNTRIEDLPQLAPDFLTRLADALEPWCPKPAPVAPSAPPENVSDARLREYALDVLAKRATILAAMQGESGRNNELLATVARVGSWVHHGILSESEVKQELLPAYEQCGGVKDHGRHQFAATIKSGLRMSANDSLRMPQEREDYRRELHQGADIAAALLHNRGGEQIAENVVPLRPGAPQPKPEFKLVKLVDLKVNTAANYLVKGVLPARGLGVVWGPAKNGKSFYVADLALHVAMGKPYRDLRVKGGPVVYCILEGSDGFSKRMEALKRQLVAEGVDLDSIPFYCVSARMELVKDKDTLIASIAAQVGGPPSLVVIDTLNRSFTGSESSDEEMTAYVKAADAITEALECLTLIVHHSGHDKTRMRGHTALIGAVDVEISVKRDEKGGPVLARVECMKDGPEGAEFMSTLRQVEIGMDDDGDPMTTCVVEPIAKEAPKPKDPNRDTRKPVTAPSAKIAIEALRELVAKEGQCIHHQPEIPPDLKCVDVESWRSLCYSRGISKGGSASANRNAFGEARQALQVAGHIGVFESRVWIIPNPNDLGNLRDRLSNMMQRKVVYSAKEDNHE